MIGLPPEGPPDPDLDQVVAHLQRLGAADWDAVAPLHQLPAPLRRGDPKPGTVPPALPVPLPPAASRRPLGPDPDPVPSRDEQRKRRRTGRRGGGRRVAPAHAALAAVAAAAAMAALVVVGITGGPAGPGGPGGTPQATPPAASASWQVTGYITGVPWQVGSAPAGGAPQATVVCTTSLTCLVAGTGYPGGTGVERSVDGGRHWSLSPLPPGTHLASGLACPASGTCVAGGLTGTVAPGTPGAAALSITTATAGTSWSQHPLPGGVAWLPDLTCPSAQVCVGLGAGLPPGGQPVGAAAPVSLSSADGGATWATGTVPEPFAPTPRTGIACGSAEHCVAVGAADANAPLSGPGASPGVALWSADAGHHWSRGAVPAGVAAFTAVSCPSAARCVALAHGTGTSGTSGTGGTAGSGNSLVLTSSDGGHSWKSAGPPTTSPTRLWSLSCPSVTSCWAVGSWTGKDPDGGPGGLILASTDGGVTWRVQPLPSGASTRPTPSTGIYGTDIQVLFSVSCPSVGTCVAVGNQASLTSAAGTQVVLRLQTT